MATKKTLNFLPTIFQTDVNNKFLSATIDQLVTEPNLRNIYGYIGRTFAPTYKNKDSYVIENSANRQKYQLEPSIVVRNDQKEITFFASYNDILNKIEYYSGLTANHDRLFDGEYYSFDPQISFDKFVNFSQYYWLADGPNPVDVNTSGVDLQKTFAVTRNANISRYDFSTGGLIKNTITLARGGEYTFEVNQLGAGFWIQTELGVDGLVNATPTVSTRSVLGVTNNGAEIGTITFNVPQSTAQERYTLMNVVASVEYAVPLAYADIQNRTVSQFVAAFPTYAGITGQLNGKTAIFIDQNLLTNRGEEAWTIPEVIDPVTGLVVSGYDAGTVIPTAQRYGVWRVQFSDISNINDPLIRLVHVQDVLLNEKVYIKSGLVNANKEFFKDYDEFFHVVPVISSIQDTLYFQDGSDPSIYGTIKLVDIAGWEIDVENDILGKSNYTSPNGVIFTSGLKVSFGTDVTPVTYQNKEYYVEGVGKTTGIQLIDIELLVTPELYNDELALNYPDGLPGNVSNAEYITINRASKDLNSWTRGNRWFHRDVIKLTAEYNNVVVTYDQTYRAQRPIIQFEADLQLFNFGRIGKRPIDILDITTRDAFNELNGQILTVIGGVTLVDGMRIIFTNDNDPVVRDSIYVINLVQTQLTDQGLLTGPVYINLNPADDANNEIYDTVVVKSGLYKGTAWWYNGDTWTQSQTKTSLQQDPLFDVYDATGTSLADYESSTFAGTRLFGYNRTSTSTTADTVLYFPLKYRTFRAQGDIEFSNYFDIDTFTHVRDRVAYTDRVTTGFLQQIVDRNTVIPTNNWNTVVEPLSQYQLITYIYDGINSPFKIDVTPEASASIPHVNVYKNNTFLKTTQWTLTNNALTLSTAPAIGDKIDILVYSTEVSALGQYQVPQNLDLNAQNIDLESLTLGQIRNHLVELSRNSSELVGDILSESNLRDIEIKSQGGNILQHSAPISNAALFLLNDSTNFIDAVRYAQQEYARFKNKFLELSATLSGIQPTDPVTSVDLILKEINKIKNKSFPWYYSDMVPYGTLRNTVNGTGYTIFDPLVRSYEITTVFDAYALGNTAVLVYLNDVQLIIDRDYTFDTDRPAITFNDTVTLEVDDNVKIVEYQDTNGSYVPETPSKLGLYPKFIPEIFLDDTYRTPINVIRGHDGSITPAFEDYRDSFVLELEKRIYNNITLRDNNSYRDIYAVVPGKFRTGDYSLNDANQLLSKNFLNWIGNNKIDFTVNDTFESNDPFTWNYGRFVDRIDGEILPGSWRACYQYFYDTIRPQLTPWEMLGFSTMPSWWVEEYGPAPYTGGNKLLWDDLELGLIKYGERAGIDAVFARPGLSAVIPVDANGYLLSPAAIMTASFNSIRAATAWAVGQQGPVETAWRNSSDYPFAAQQALALAKPARYFGLLMDISRYSKNNVLAQYITDTNDHIKQTSLTFNGDTSSGAVVRTAGYINWIADFLVNQGINPSTVITPLLKNYEVNLAYKMAGFSDQKYLQVLAEQSSPTSTNDSIIIPNENYNVHLYKSTPVDKITYSGVIVEKTTNGYSVRGYNLANPFFTIIPSVINSNAYKITVLNNSVTVFKDYQNLKLTVPYGYEFNTQQQIADFLISYERHLMAQGFTFNDTDEQLGETRNWKLSTKEFLFWAQQGWAPGSILVLSPVANVINAVTVGAITDAITDSQYGSKVLDQNFALVKTTNYNVLRSPTAFKLTLTNDAVIGYIELNLVQYEHVLIFDNTTVFNDIIYKPELGNRQFRLKLIGQKTADWDGSLSAPGFIYNSGDVNAWTGGKDYLKGDLIQYKNQYYVALQNVSATTEFAFSYWKQIATSEIKKGLLPNFATIAAKSQVYYDSYTNFKDADQIKYSHGLIGFKPRQYLADLGLSDTTQIELYKGFIKQKGSANAINQLTNAEFNNLSSAINFYEEWAIRVGEYGALDTNPYVEIALDEKAFSVNPAIATFVTAVNSDGVTTFNKSQLYKSTEQYAGTIALNRDASSDYYNDIATAGYVNIDDVDTTIFDLTNFTDLNNQLTNIGTGYTIWCAKDFSQNWNVYRVTETDNHVLLVSNSLDGFVTFTTDDPHGLSAGDVFLIRSFTTEFDGFYQVESIVDLNNILVKYSGDTTQLTTLDGDGMLFILDSIRFQYMEDARLYTPPHQWKVGEKIWIDDDAATTIAQGQSYDTGDNLWKVYEKTHPWEIDQRLVKNIGEYSANIGYGQALKMIDNAEQTIFVGTTLYANLSVSTNTGVVNVFNNTTVVTLSGNVTVTAGDYVTQSSTGANLTVLVSGANISNISVSYNGNTTLTTATPTSGGNIAVNGSNVTVYPTTITSVGYVETTTIVPDGANTFTFGSHIDTAVDPFIDDGVDGRETLAVSAPTSSGLAGAANVGLLYIYKETAGTENWVRGQVIAGNVSATGGKFGTGFAFDELGHWLYVGAPYEAIPKVYVYGLQRFITEATGSVTTSGSVSTVTVPFTRDTTISSTDANSISVTSATRTYIPRIDYTISGQTITFISGNIPTATTLTISQSPYYALVETISGPAGSEFGFCIDASLNGAQLGVGAPGDTVIGTDGVSMAQAGAVYVYDRVIEAFNSTNGTVYVTEEDIAPVHAVTVDDIETLDYAVTGTNEITLFVPIGIGKNVKIETNKFTLLERLIGIDSLDGSLTAIQQGARFGSSLTICSNNCAFYIGAPYYNADTIYNTGAVWKFHNRGTLYGTNTGQIQNPTFTPGDTIRLDNFQITVTGTSLDSLVEDINDANLLGITAVNEAGYLRLNSDKTVAKNRLRVLSGSGTVYADAGLAIFAFMQIIVNPYGSSNEYFGTKVILARNAYMLVISSDRGTTNTFTTFDSDTTVIDDDSTSFVDSVKASGSVYTYELYDDPRNQVEHPGRYAFCQQIDPTDLNTGDGFGAAFDIIGEYIIVSAPSDDTTITNGGSIYLFNNPTGRRGWSLIRYQQPTVDIESVNRMYLYSNLSNTILTTLEFIDPAKGKILGRADQEISYKTGYDPAVYNRGTNSAVSLNDTIFWSSTQVGQVWWNLSQLSYIDYEQDTLTYRSINWGRLFPGSTVEVLEWVESAYLPSAYVASGGEGIPKYEDNSAYVELVYVDTVTNIISIKYFYWVKNKTTVDLNNTTRRLPLTTIQDIIENPKNQGTPYAAIIQNNAFVLYNVGSYLSAQNTILHLDYNTVKNTNIIHSEYELVEKGNADSIISPKIINKLIDSLAGIDILGAAVPDPALSVADKFGLGTRPRQAMFADRIAAYANLVEYANSILITKPIARNCDLTTISSAEAQPNIKLGEYELKIATEIELAYIDVDVLATGYKVLVNQDTTRDNLWVLYELSANKQWVVSRVQSYKTDLYWDYVDWYAPGFGIDTQLEYVVETLTDALKLPVAIGDDVLVRVSSGGNRGWNLLVLNSTGQFDVVGIQEGTIQLKTSTGNFINNTTPTTEVRYIINALKDDIFVGELDTEFNKLFFVMINYLFNEQKYVDWIFKTSFISVSHKLRSLLQYPNYIKDNQTYYEDYITEVKPYSTKIREYSINYDSTDEFAGSVTDFDLPGYYDTDTKVFRSPSGENVIKDEALWQTDTYNQWYANRNHRVESIIVEYGGSGYTAEPVVTILGGGLAAAGATARAIIDFDLGTVTSIEILTRGTGYFLTPTVLINGTHTTPATAYAILKNNQIRTFDTTLKFDRISYTSNVQEWTANTAYTVGDIVTHTGSLAGATRHAFIVTANITSGSTFVHTDDYARYSSANFTNANDRIVGYYEPGASMPARDLTQLLRGIDYPGVTVQGLGFDQAPEFDGATPFDNGLFDNIQYDVDGLPMLDDATIDTIIRSDYTDLALGTRAEDIDVVGGAYVDTYSSHAPEEMVPGIVFDTLDMQVYTKINGNVDVIAYRMFSNMMREESYLRIADAHATTLAAPLRIIDTEIFVTDASKLAEPFIDAIGPAKLAIPGVIFVNGERITYFTRNLSTNKLGQIRRGTQGTSAPTIQYAGTVVTDGGADQVVPGTVANVVLSTTTPYTVTSTPSYYLSLTGSVTANVGDVITQTISSSSLTVAGIDSVARVLLVRRNNTNSLTFQNNYLKLSGNVTVSSGDYITQESTGANLIVLTTGANISNISVSYYGITTLATGKNSGNIAVNGSNVAVYPTTVTGNVILNTEMIINGTSTGNVYPLSIVPVGRNNDGNPFVDGNGNVTIAANIELHTTNVWYNLGSGVATDGTGFNGSTTVPVTFLKGSTATNIVVTAIKDMITTEDAVNTLTTEDSKTIIED